LLWGRESAFSTKRTEYSNVHIMEITAWIPFQANFAYQSRPAKTSKYSKYASWVVQKHGTQIQDGGRPNIWRLAYFRFWHAHLSHSHILVMRKIKNLIADGQNRYFP